MPLCWTLATLQLPLFNLINIDLTAGLVFISIFFFIIDYWVVCYFETNVLVYNK